MSTQNAIEVNQVSKSFKRVFDKPKSIKESLIIWKKRKIEYHKVLDNISVDIKKGETVCLIGTNGSGKSTLLKLMTKILYPNSGTIKTYGKLVSLLELGAGFHPDFTGRENIYFNASIFGLTRNEIETRLDEIINFSELGSFIDNPVRTYSSGMYMRLAFSVAINVDADILLIDEILAVGDQHFQEKCLNKLHELKNSDKTIVIVSHSMEILKELCSRAIWIYKGNIAGDGNPNKIVPMYLEKIDEDYQVEASQTDGIELEGLITIDEPSSEAVIPSANKIVLLKGWELSNEKNSIMKIYLGKDLLATASREERLDVISVYAGQYGGMASNKKAGWRYTLDITNLKGLQNLLFRIETEKGEVIKEKSLIINIT